MLERLHEITSTSERLVEFRHTMRSDAFNEGFRNELVNGIDLIASDVLSTCDRNAHVSAIALFVFDACETRQVSVGLAFMSFTL